jgi:outer membrane protein assembly factor BamB
MRVAVSLAVMFSLPLVMASDWPQWRGPSMDGTSDAASLPLTWAEGRNVAWKSPLPSWSGSTPIVWKDRVFVTSASPASADNKAPTIKPMGKLPADGRDLLVLCLARDDGRVLWSYTLDAGNARIGKQNLSSPSPVTDGNRVYVMTGTGVFTALTLDGKFVWKREIQKDYGAFGLLWGYASSPLLLDGKLIVEVLHGSHTDQPSYLLAIDPATGKTIWKVERPTDALEESPDAYTTPVTLSGSKPAMFIVSGGDYITAHKAADGAEVWRCGGLNPGRNERWRAVASPEVCERTVFASVREGPLVACRTGGRGLVTSTHLAWTSPIAPDVPTPVTDGKLVYVLQDRAMLTCFENDTGKVVYEKQRLPRGTYSASPLLAVGRLYVTSEDARTMVIAAGPEFKVLAENKLDDAYTLSSIAVAGEQLFIRTSGHLYCIRAANTTQPSR